jgi:hypothetical protein
MNAAELEKAARASFSAVAEKLSLSFTEPKLCADGSVRAEYESDVEAGACWFAIEDGGKVALHVEPAGDLDEDFLVALSTALCDGFGDGSTQVSAVRLPALDRDRLRPLPEDPPFEDFEALVAHCVEVWGAEERSNSVLALDVKWDDGSEPTPVIITLRMRGPKGRVPWIEVKALVADLHVLWLDASLSEHDFAGIGGGFIAEGETLYLVHSVQFPSPSMLDELIEGLAASALEILKAQQARD